MSWDSLIPVAGMVASIIAAAAVARHQIKKLELDAEKSVARLDRQDIRLEKLTTASETQEQRLNILASILSPSELDRRAREQSAMMTDITWIKRKLGSP